MNSYASQKSLYSPTLDEGAEECTHKMAEEHNQCLMKSEDKTDYFTKTKNNEKNTRQIFDDGHVNKYYNFLFTGKNDQIIDFNISLDAELIKVFTSPNDIWSYEDYKKNNDSVRADAMQMLTKKFEKKYPDQKNVPRPPHWSGWCLKPSSIEFWLHKDNRIHERLRYNKIANDWKKEILYP